MADGIGDNTDPRAPTLGEIGLWRFAPYLMNRIMGRYNAELQDQLRARDLTTAKMRALAVLAVVPGLTINQLSVYAVTEQSTMSRTLESLERQGLVRRRNSENDGRVREITLTEAGREVFELVWPEMREANDAMFRGIDEAEREAFVGTLQKILMNIRKNPF